MSVSLFYTQHNGPRLHSFEPPGTSQKCSLAYLNEGGANFVFRILRHAEGEELPFHLRGKLLRLRKDVPHVQSAREQLAAFDEHFKPLFPPESLIQYELIEFDEGVPSRINNELKKLQRPPHRLRDLLPTDETYGLLVTDMTPQSGDVLLQLKPKWLAQAPHAPRDARRCRTCALRAHRASQKKRTATDAQESCPLGLISNSTEERKKAAQSITSDDQLQGYLIYEAQPLLETLRSWQNRLDPHGILGGEYYNPADYCKVMTLRDCTLFLLKRSGSQIEARIADLDMKQPVKLATWKKAEKELISGGWYTNSENDADWSEEKVCVLSR